MNSSDSRLKRLHRGLMAVTVLAVSILLALSLTGIISQAEALKLFVVIELPERVKLFVCGA